MPRRVVVTWIPATPGQGDALDIEAFANTSKLSLPIQLPREAKVELLDMFSMVVASPQIEKALEFWGMIEMAMANAFVDEDRTQPVAGADGEPLVPPEFIAAYHLNRITMGPMLAQMLQRAQADGDAPAEPAGEMAVEGPGAGG